MNRLRQARLGFLNRDLSAEKRAHTLKAIDESILHREEHIPKFNLPEVILGGQDGLVNVLGVILGVAAATSDSRLVIIAGLAATFAESISMGAVAFTSTLAEADYYQSEFEREKWEIENMPEAEKNEVKALYSRYGFSGKILDEIVTKITTDKTVWLKIMMEQELRLMPISRADALPAAMIVGISAIVGSFIPLLPFFILPISAAIMVSVVLSSASLFLIGFYKAQKTLGRKFVRSGVEMLVIGMVSAFVGYLIGSLLKIDGIF